MHHQSGHGWDETRSLKLESQVVMELRWVLSGPLVGGKLLKGQQQHQQQQPRLLAMNGTQAQRASEAQAACLSTSLRGRPGRSRWHHTGGLPHRPSQTRHPAAREPRSRHGEGGPLGGSYGVCAQDNLPLVVLAAASARQASGCCMHNRVPGTLLASNEAGAYCALDLDCQVALPGVLIWAGALLDLRRTGRVKRRVRHGTERSSKDASLAYGCTGRWIISTSLCLAAILKRLAAQGASAGVQLQSITVPCQTH